MLIWLICTIVAGFLLELGFAVARTRRGATARITAGAERLGN
jgi:hypothetical protein